MSKADNETSKPKPPTREGKNNAVTEFQKEWDRVKDGVIKGTLPPEQLKETAETFLKHRLVAGADADKAVQNIIKDCKAANISDDNLHKFVGAALNAELELEKRKVDSTGLMRFSASTVAGPLLKYEVEKRGFEPKLFDVVKNGTDKQIIDAFMDIKIPPYLKDHYGPIVDHYRASGGTEGVQNAFTNLVFNNLYPNLIAANSAKYNELVKQHGLNDPAVKAESTEMGKTLTKMADLSHAAYPTKGASKIAGANAEVEAAFAKQGMFSALEKQFDPDPAKQQLSEKEMTELKERAYARDAIQKEDRLAREVLSPKPQTPEKAQPIQKTKVKTKDKTLVERFEEFKHQAMDKASRVSQQVAANARTSVKDLKTASNELVGDMQNAATVTAKLAHDAKAALKTSGKKDVPTLPTAVAKRAADIMHNAATHPSQPHASTTKKPRQGHEGGFSH